MKLHQTLLQLQEGATSTRVPMHMVFTIGSIIWINKCADNMIVIDTLCQAQQGATSTVQMHMDPHQGTPKIFNVVVVSEQRAPVAEVPR